MQVPKPMEKAIVLQGICIHICKTNWRQNDNKSVIDFFFHCQIFSVYKILRKKN